MEVRNRKTVLDINFVKELVQHCLNADEKIEQVTIMRITGMTWGNWTDWRKLRKSMKNCSGRINERIV